MQALVGQLGPAHASSAPWLRAELARRRRRHAALLAEARAGDEPLAAEARARAALATAERTLQRRLKDFVMGVGGPRAADRLACVGLWFFAATRPETPRAR